MTCAPAHATMAPDELKQLEDALDAFEHALAAYMRAGYRGTAGIGICITSSRVVRLLHMLSI
jgi:hypothetical protein